MTCIDGCVGFLPDRDMARVRLPGGASGYKQERALRAPRLLPPSKKGLRIVEAVLPGRSSSPEATGWSPLQFSAKSPAIMLVWRGVRDSNPLVQRRERPDWSRTRPYSSRKRSIPKPPED